MLSFVVWLKTLIFTYIRRQYNVGLFGDNKLQFFYCAVVQIGVGRLKC